MIDFATDEWSLKTFVLLRVLFFVVVAKETSSRLVSTIAPTHIFLGDGTSLLNNKTKQNENKKRSKIKN